ncbi:MAG TPA: beta-ketoacyl-ACP synthase III [Polyangiaceae bacterium]|nr:beta-ketoacyl-ACP synthase III [Polyangiaceae bacterium]
MGIQITGVGAYSPSKVVTNHDLAQTIDTSHEWIVAHTGIEARRISAPEEAPSDMGYQAAVRCLRDAGVESAAVDLIVVACATPDQSQPAVACRIQEKLGIADRHCPAFDVNSVCAGFVFALDTAQSLMLANPQRYDNALVIGSDAFSKILNWQDRRTCIFFGDGAGAVLLSRTADSDRRIHCALGSDGRGRHYIEVPAGGTRTPVDEEVLAKRLNKFVMHGPKVWDFAIATVPLAIRTLLGEHGLRPTDLDLLILHQSNLRMIESIMASLELPMDRTVTTLETHGNTAAASIPITLQRAAELGKLRPGSRVALCGFGGGLSWGAALLEW